MVGVICVHECFLTIYIHAQECQNISGAALRKRACAIVFGRESPYKVHFEAALMHRKTGTAPNYIFQK